MAQYRSKMARYAALLAVAGLALAGCKESVTAGASGTADSGSASSSSPAAAAGGSTTSAIFPIGVGNTWVYDTKLGTGATSTVTNKMTDVTPVAGGQQVSMLVDTGTAKPVTVTYVFHDDGSISVPVTQLGSSVTVTSGSLVWPSQAQLATGQPHDTTLVFSLQAAGTTTHITAHVTIRGQGTQTVTVPAGTYRAEVINEQFSEKFAGVNVSFSLDTWLAPGVGPVKSQLASASSSSVPSTVEVLRSFTKG